jgi:glycosyltransferase involved in cell wall biosynthesis
MKLSVIIPTFNRCEELSRTLRDLATVQSDYVWELIVVDNNSTDRTREVVDESARTFPVPVRYVFEREQGRCPALNAGTAAARGEIIIHTDDDLRFDTNWLNAAVHGLDRLACDYVGGKILPLWPDDVRPAWLSTDSARQRAVIAIADYGEEAIPFGSGPAMGCNFAVRREAVQRVGLWDARVGRKGTSLLGQEQREWCMRARSAGVRGFYLPDMIVHHVVPPERLSKRYFRRWFYWHGVSRAIMYREFGLDLESPEETVLDYSKVPHIAGVPRYLYRTALAYLFRTMRAYVRRSSAEAFDQELWLWFFAGVVRHLSLRRRAAKPI